MATLNKKKIIESGVNAATTAAAVAGDEFKNTGVEFIRISNYHRTNTYTVKVQVQNSTVVHPQYGPTTKNHIYRAIASPGSGASANVGEVTAYIGPFKPKAFNDANGMVKIYYKTGNVASDSSFSGASAIPSSNALLEIDIVYLDN